MITSLNVVSVFPQTSAHGKKFAIIENEFGEIGIDDALIVRREELHVYIIYIYICIEL